MSFTLEKNNLPGQVKHAKRQIDEVSSVYASFSSSVAMAGPPVDVRPGEGGPDWVRLEVDHARCQSQYRPCLPPREMRTQRGSNECPFLRPSVVSSFSMRRLVGVVSYFPNAKLTSEAWRGRCVGESASV